MNLTTGIQTGVTDTVGSNGRISALDDREIYNT